MFANTTVTGPQSAQGAPSGTTCYWFRVHVQGVHRIQSGGPDSQGVLARDKVLSRDHVPDGGLLHVQWEHSDCDNYFIIGHFVLDHLQGSITMFYIIKDNGP